MIRHIAIALSCISLAWADSATDGAWRLVWSDEFEQDGAVDVSRWRGEVGRGRNGWGNHEQQYYTTRLKNVRVEDGRLIIEAHREEFGDAAYTSARIKTLGSGDWQGGRFEIRAKLPGGRGMWPAIWLMPSENVYGHWPRSGEIDLMEFVGYDPTRVFGTVHTQSFNHMKGTQLSGYHQMKTAASAFHTYGLQWTDDELVWLVDGEPYHRIAREPHFTPDEWPFDQKFHLILNVAVGGMLGGKMGVDDSGFPQRMEVDFVRVYQLGAATVENQPDGGAFSPPR